MTNELDWWCDQLIFRNRLPVVYNVHWSRNQENDVTNFHRWSRGTSEENFEFKQIEDKGNICTEKYVEKWLPQERVLFHFHRHTCRYVLASLNPVNLISFWTVNGKVTLLRLNPGYRFQLLWFFRCSDQHFLKEKLKRMSRSKEDYRLKSNKGTYGSCNVSTRLMKRVIPCRIEKPFEIYKLTFITSEMPKILVQRYYCIFHYPKLVKRIIVPTFWYHF